MTAVSSEVAAAQVTRKTGIRWSRIGLHVFLFTMALVWLFPLVYAFYTSLRPYADTAKLGYASVGGSYNFDNYVKAFTDGQLPSYFLNTVIVVVPAVFLTLLLASMAAFVLSRFSWRFNLLFLMIFTAGNLLPQQVIITPLFRMYLLLPLPRSPERQRDLVRPVLRRDRDPRGVPARLLHVRPQQLHEDPAP